MDTDDIRRELDGMHAAIKEIEKRNADVDHRQDKHEAVCALRYQAIIERLDKPGKWFGRAVAAGSGVLALLHIIDWIKGTIR
jgi:hypothetical protein